MKEFLNYEILGLITVQTYLIVAFIDFVVCAALNKRNTPASKLFAQAFFWPLNVLIIILVAVFAVIAGVFSVIVSGKRK